jgi:hypothetical protein
MVNLYKPEPGDATVEHGQKREKELGLATVSLPPKRTDRKKKSARKCI